MEIKYRMRKTPEYTAHGKEVVKVLDDRPHLLVRLEVKGTYFPNRAAHPFVMIQLDQPSGRQEYYKDLFTQVSPDNRKLIGYLPVNVPQNGTIVFGYGDEIWGALPHDFSPEDLIRLDRKRLPKNLVVVDNRFMKMKAPTTASDPPA